MSFAQIRIVRQYPIINGFVQLPNNLERNRSASLLESLNLDSITQVGHLEARVGGARSAGGKYGIQEWIEICNETVECCSTPCDAAEDLKDTLVNTTNPGNRPPGEVQWND